MKILLKKKYILSFFLYGLNLFFCYLISGICGEVFDDGVPVLKAIGTVFRTPFSNHFNDFTPILLLIGFIMSETIWVFQYLKPEFKFRNIFKNNMSVENGDSDSATNMEQVHNSSNTTKEVADEPVHAESVEPKSFSDSEDIDLSKFGFVVPDDVTEVQKEKVESGTDKREEDIAEPEKIFSADETVEDELLSFSSDIFWDLNGDYTPEQIKEMVILKRYIKNLSAEMLRKTFSPSLSAEEIREYIELFYG